VGDRIEVFGGKVCRAGDGKESYEDNHVGCVLDLGTMAWSKVS
jgi:hypothetical protein